MQGGDTTLIDTLAKDATDLITAYQTAYGNAPQTSSGASASGAMIAVRGAPNAGAAACPFALTHLLDDQAPGGKRAKQLGFGTDQVEQSKPIRTMQDDHLSIVYRRRSVARPQPDGKRGPVRGRRSAGSAARD